MELAFTKTDNLFISEFQVNSDFNLHVERDELGKFVIWVKTTPVGNYAKVNHEENLDDLYVIDYNFTGTVYPKYIKIVSKVEPTYAAITTDGEVTEIKTQSKEIEITSNGTTVITPDSGFAYLDRVSVKTDISGSGGGVGYLYFENVPPMLEPLMFSSLINDGTRIIPSFLCGFNSQGKEENITVYKIAAMYGYTFDGMKITEDFLREFMSIDGIVEITEEEFYNLNVPE